MHDTTRVNRPGQGSRCVMIQEAAFTAPSPTPRASRPTRRTIDPGEAPSMTAQGPITRKTAGRQRAMVRFAAGSWLPFIALIGGGFSVACRCRGGAARRRGFGKSREKCSPRRDGQGGRRRRVAASTKPSRTCRRSSILRDPGKLQRLGGRIPRGRGVGGPHGTGKTL